MKIEGGKMKEGGISHDVCFVVSVATDCYRMQSNEMRTFVPLRNDNTPSPSCRAAATRHWGASRLPRPLRASS